MSNVISTAFNRIFHSTSKAVDNVMASKGSRDVFVSNLASLANGIPKNAFSDRLQAEAFTRHTETLGESISRGQVRSALKEVREIKREAERSQRAYAEGLTGSSNRQAYAELQMTKEMAAAILHAPHKAA